MNAWRKAFAESFPSIDWSGLSSCEIGNGWRAILLTAISKLSNIAQTFDCSVYVYQIKQKFGSLVIYAGAQTQQAGIQVDIVCCDAEKQSSSICEVCGAPGRKHYQYLDSTGWQRTLCDMCARSIGYK